MAEKEQRQLTTKAISDALSEVFEAARILSDVLARNEHIAGLHHVRYGDTSPEFSISEWEAKMLARLGIVFAQSTAPNEG